MLNIELITHALRMLGVLRANAQASAEAAALGLLELNDLISDMESEGIRLGYYPQTNVSAETPLSDSDAASVKPLLAIRLRIHYPAAEPPPDLDARAIGARDRLLRDAVLTNAKQASLTNIPLGIARGHFDITSGY